jgi:hypothetical protein
MNSKFLRLISLFIFVILICCTCRKKDDGNLTFDHRIIAYSDYYNNVLEGHGEIEYADNKMTKLTEKYYSSGTLSGTQTMTITYPDANSIHVIMVDPQTSSSSSVTDVNLTNGKPVMRVESYGGINRSKQEFQYNSDGTLNKISSYSYNNGTWQLSYETIYTYSSGKIIQISEVYSSGTFTYETKHVYTYDGEKVLEEIDSSKPYNGTWTETGKDVYSYTGSNITGISHYYKSGISWTASGSNETYTYDKDNNLVKIVSDNDRTEFTYQDGTGNFLLILQALGASDSPFSPMPHKKSLNLFR